MTNRAADVYPYDSSYKSIANVPIVSGATAWDDPFTGETYILVFHESLFYGPKLDHSLINPNQIRMNGIGFWDNPFDRTRELSIEIERGPVIPLEFKGTKLMFSSRVPTKDELDRCHHIDMTSPLEWNPSQVVLGEIASDRQKAPPFSVIIGKVTRENNAFYIRDADVHGYELGGTDDYLLHSVDPTLIGLRERIIESTTVEEWHHEDVPSRRTFISTERHKKLSAESISDLWCIGIKRARNTLNATTQRGIRSAILPLSRRYRSDRRYNMKRLNGKFATDTLYAEVKSLHQNTCAQLYSHKVGFSACYPIRNATGDELGYTLQDFCNDFGVPEHLKSDGHMSQVGINTLFKQLIRRHDIKHKISEPRRPNQNPAESAIREVKKRWYRIMMKKAVPKRLWDYGIVWVCETGNLSVSSSRYAAGRTPLEFITGETPDISEYTDFSFYDWVLYKPNAGLGEEQLGRWLGVSHKVGDQMSYWILPLSCTVISCVTVQRLTIGDQQKREVQDRMDMFDKIVNDRLNKNDTEVLGYSQDVPAWNRLSTNDEDLDFLEDFNRIIKDNSILEADELNKYEETHHTSEAFDGYISMEIGLPRGSDDSLHHAKVKRRAVDVDGIPVGVYHNNPLLDTRKYEIEFVDGTTEIVTANVIAENILAQVDEEGHRQLLIEEIIDHRTGPDALGKDKGFTETKYGSKRRVKTTKGWEFCVEWKDGSTDWVALKDLKHAYPVQLATYAINNKIQEEPAFAWWVPYTMKKRKAIISKLKSKYWQRTHKYGIRIPKSVKEAYQID